MDEFPAILPVRPSAGALDASRIRQILHHNHDALRDALDRVAGLVEMGLTLPARSIREPGAASDPGTRYLKSFLPGEGLRARAGRWACSMDRHLTDLARARTAWDRRGNLVISYLIDRRDVQAAVEGHRRLVPPGERSRIRLGGPWPPFSFVTLDLHQPGSAGPDGRAGGDGWAR